MADYWHFVVVLAVDFELAAVQFAVEALEVDFFEDFAAVLAAIEHLGVEYFVLVVEAIVEVEFADFVDSVLAG